MQDEPNVTAEQVIDKSDWLLLPPNPYYKREYRSSCDLGSVEVSISAPGGRLPVGEDADDQIAFLKLIIRQLERARDKAALLTKLEEPAT